jgi:myo-inositol-1(or 4)-monophosphatase
VAQTAVAAAGAILLEGWGMRPTVRFKSSASDLVTEFDGRAEVAIMDILAAAFPDDAIVAEEGARQEGKSGRIWYVDPLDGTTNFSHGLPLFGTSIGLWANELPVMGVITAPALGWVFYGADGLGAYRGEEPISVSQVTDLQRSLLVTGFPYVRGVGTDNFPEFTTFMRASQGVRRLGSAALDLCFVACGWLDGFWERHIKAWDLVAGAAIVRAAGGQVSDPDEGPFKPETGCILASNGHLHEAMKIILDRVRATKLADS